MKEFAKTKKGKVCIAAAAAVLLAAIAIGIWQFWLYRQPKFRDVTIELGTTSLGIDQFATEYAKLSKCAFASDVSTLDIGKAGSYALTLRHGRQEQEVTLTVVDTTAPEVTFITERTESSGYVPAAADFVESCTDLSPVTVTFAEDPGVPEDMRPLTLTVVVTDAQGNEVRQECTLNYIWMPETLRLEYGTPLTVADILLNPEKDAELVSEDIINSVNSRGPGEYYIRSVSGGVESVCVVTVEDTVGPVLELQTISVYVGRTAKAEDFIVSVEDYSGVKEVRLVTEPDFQTQGAQTVVLEAEDICGNITSQETTLYVVTNLTPPVISGLRTLQIEKNGTGNYLEGVIAMDDEDGVCDVWYDADSVDTTTAGFYYVTYYAMDKSGNTASARRKVEVLHDASDTQELVNLIAAAQSSDPEALRDYVRNTVAYSSDWGGDDPVWYGFKEKTGNCYVHAMCLKVLLDYYGYETQLIWTTCKTHYWLLINLNGVWRHIDPTPSTIHSRYSLMTDDQRYETLKGRDWDRSAWPTCD